MPLSFTLESREDFSISFSEKSVSGGKSQFLARTTLFFSRFLVGRRGLAARREERLVDSICSLFLVSPPLAKKTQNDLTAATGSHVPPKIERGGKHRPNFEKKAKKEPLAAEMIEICAAAPQKKNVHDGTFPKQ